MMDEDAIETALTELETVNGIENVVLISRSGMHIAGKVPKGAHTETFSAMFAILLGAAETATSELKEKLDHVLLSIGEKKVLVMDKGPKVLFVIKITNVTNLDAIVKEVNKYSKKMESLV
jgi:predicted regulator of Ras-like GTPase activity (Roadblock/LC7/MglB family)